LAYQFGDITLDPDSLELKQGGEVVEVEPQVFSLLVCLIENRDRVMSKDEIIEQVWDGRIVSDGTLNTRINATRKAVGDDGKAQAVIKTFPRRGFRFVADLDGDVQGEMATVTKPLSDKPSIAVLPFANLSGDPEQEYFSDGITEDILTAIGRIRHFFVIARNTTFTYKGQSVDVHTIARELGVQYVLEGSVRKAGDRIRITVKLNDGLTGNQIWAENYDRELKDIFAVQDEITQTVVGAIEPEMAETERGRAKSKPSDNLDSWDLYQQGMSHYYSPENSTLYDQAESFFRRAIELEPNFSLPYSWLAELLFRKILQSIGDQDSSSREAFTAGLKAVELDPNDAAAHSGLGSAHLARREHAKAIHQFESALRLNPSNYMANLHLGAALVWSGRATEAIPNLENAIKLSPRDPLLGPAFARLAEAHMFLGEFDLAVGFAQRAVTYNVIGIWINAVLTAALAHSDRKLEMREAYADLLKRKPDFSCTYLLENLPVIDIEYRDIYLDGLRKAGVPES
jgi:TolB-like protein